MTKIFIVHGTYGYPEENWIPWLRQQLAHSDCEIRVPQFPTPEHQTLEDWLAVFDQHRDWIDESTILIGHSVGAAFLLSALEALTVKVRSTVLIAGFAHSLPTVSKVVGSLVSTFIEKEFDWTKIRQQSQEFHVFVSDNDPFVPFSLGGELARNLGCELTIIKNAGHFNEQAGYTTFPQLLDLLRQTL